MRLADRIAQCRLPLVVQSIRDGSLTQLSGAAAYSREIAACPVRYVLTDELTRLCTGLAYSKGARTLACADLMHIPAARVWIEWCEAPYTAELERYGFRFADEAPPSGRRGLFIQGMPGGRRGFARSFWSTGDGAAEVLAGSMECYFDFDTPAGGDPAPPDGGNGRSVQVVDRELGRADIIQRCFRFRFEQTWSDYYAKANLSETAREQVTRCAVGTIAIAVPVMLAFFLLLATRPGLPRRPLMLERLNRARQRSGRMPLLDHVEVTAPLLPEYRACNDAGRSSGRRMPRLHHVRGHLVRRGNQLHWRIPHLRGSARMGVVQSRTVTWTVGSCTESSA